MHASSSAAVFFAHQFFPRYVLVMRTYQIICKLLLRRAGGGRQTFWGGGGGGGGGGEQQKINLVETNYVAYLHYWSGYSYLRQEELCWTMKV